jgi:hypothetical protein
VLSEREFRESLMPTTVQAGYDKGFFIKSSDDKFKLNIGGQLQFRWTYYNSQPQNRYQSPGFRHSDRTGFDWNRFRLKLSGHVYDPALTYWIEMEMGSNSGLNAGLLYGWINYKFREEFQFRAGTFRLASTRADFGSTSDMQFPEYPTMNAVFGLVRGTGVRLWGRLFKNASIKDKADGDPYQGEWYLDIVNAPGNLATAATITNDENYYTNSYDGNPAIIFRNVWQILRGHMAHPEDASPWTSPAADLEFHTSPALNAGYHFAFQPDVTDGALKIPYPQHTTYRTGGFGLTDSQGMQIYQFGGDVGFKYRGFSATAEYVMRALDVKDSSRPPFTPLFQLTGDSSTNVQHGGYVQVGYLLPLGGKLERKIEVVGRVGGISTLAAGQEGTWDYGGGINYYIQGNRVKLQADVVKTYEAAISGGSYSLANVNDDVLVFRVQLQVAF